LALILFCGERVLCRQGNRNRSNRQTEKNTNPHTFLFIGVCMQQASKARAKTRKSLVVGLVKPAPVLSTMQSLCSTFNLAGTAGVP